MKETLLPNNFKKIGLIIGSLSFISFILIKFDFLIFSFQENDEVIKWIIKDLILLSISVFCFSKEKNETNEMNSIRFKHLKNAVVFGTIWWLLDSIYGLIFHGSNLHMKSAYEILILMTLFYAINFNLRNYNQKAST